MDAHCGWSLTYHHFRQMYLDQFLLLLYERVALFQFSAAISNFSHQYIGHKEDKAAGKFNKLRKQFMFMTNLYQFPMFTTQQQGLEMYTQARESLSIKELYDEIATEIHETDAYFAQQRDDTRNRQLATLQWVGAVVASIALALTGMQVLAVTDTDWAAPTNIIFEATNALGHPLTITAVRAAVSVVIAVGGVIGIIGGGVLIWKCVLWIWRRSRKAPRD